MDTSRRATRYDFFKLIVAIILLILFFMLNRRATPQSPTAISTLTSVPMLFGNTQPTTLPTSSTSLSLTSTSVPLPSLTGTNAAISTQTPLLSLTPTTVSARTIPPLSSPTETSAAISTQTPLLSPTLTNVAESTTTSLASPTATPMTSSTPTPIAEIPVVSACDAASSRSRLQKGMNAIILRRLNFRSSPGIQNNWLLTNIPGTRVEVVGRPECVPHAAGAYVWWQIKLPDGQIGWSAEASRRGAFYFLEPAP